MLRLFLGLCLPKSVKDQLAPMKSGLPEARWIDRENLHLTIRFIGEVEETLAEDIHDGLSTLKFEAFPLQLKGIDCFQSRNKVRSVWTGTVTSYHLKTLKRKVEQNLRRTGLQVETRKFSPHVTLARLKRAPLTSVIPYLEANCGFQTESFQVDQVFLFRSHLGHRGATYETLAAYPEKN